VGAAMSAIRPNSTALNAVRSLCRLLLLPDLDSAQHLVGGDETNTEPKLLSYTTKDNKLECRIWSRDINTRDGKNDYYEP
jgi:hypothetical protein